MKKLPIYISLLLLLTCAKEDSQTPNNPPSQVIKQYTLSVTAGDGGSVSSTGGTFSQGTQVSITATPNAGYSFSSWSNGSTANPLSVTLNSNTSVTANFQVIVNSYTLTVSAGEGGSVSSEGGEYEEGTEVTITAIPDDGYEFTGWSDGEVSISRTFNINSNINIEALFDIQRILLQLDQHLISQPSLVPFNQLINNHETDDYIISNKGWLGITSQESHNGGFYGNNPITPGVFFFMYKHILNTDLNNDGLEDMIIGFDRSPHTVSSLQTGIPFFSLINLGDGNFEFSQEYFSQNFERKPMSMYRSVSHDLNGDGIKDFILGMRSEPVISLIDGGTNGGPAIPLLALSSDSGYYDNSSNLNGIYPGTVSEDDCCNDFGDPYFISDRGMALGDFDNDGDIDFFITRKILLNDGNGNFFMSDIQLDNNLIPEFIDPPWSNTYEAFSDDFNNDGFSDIVIAPDSGYIVRNGGSGWIALSNGTPNFSEWNKILLPDPVYLNNSKLNDIETTDFDNDGYVDLILATSRDNPYYHGHGIQLLKNDNGNGFIDVTNSKIDDQSLFDDRHGEGELIVTDFNNDSKLDIIHLLANYGASHSGTQIYINNNGYFEIYDSEDLLPKTGYSNLVGYGQFDDFTVKSVKRGLPININNDGKLDFISILREVGNDQNFPNITTNVFYSIISKD